MSYPPLLLRYNTTFGRRRPRARRTTSGWCTGGRPRSLFQQAISKILCSGPTVEFGAALFLVQQIIGDPTWQPKNWKTTQIDMPRHLKTRTAAPSQLSSSTSVSDVVQKVIHDVRERGDVAVRQYSQQFDSWSPPTFKLTPQDIQNAVADVPEQTIRDIKHVQANVRAFAQAQRNSVKDFELEIQPGVFLGQRNNPISSVGA